MNYFAIPPIITLILIFLEGLLVYANNRRSKPNILYGLFCLSLCMWLFGFSAMYLSKDPQSALDWARNGFFGIIFVPIFAYHFVMAFLRAKTDFVLWFLYITGIPSLFIFKTNLFYKNVSVNFWGWYPVAGKFYILFFACFLVGFCGAMVRLVMALRQKGDNKLVGYKRNQVLYLLFAFGVGTTGIVDYLIKFEGISIYPWGYLSALGLITFFALAIVKYHLMNIRLAVTRAGVFLFVYTLVLGIPFYVGAKVSSHWLVPTGIAVILATLGPYLYLFIQERIEKRILQKELRVQQLLVQASYGMNAIRDLHKLLKVIVDIITKSLRLQSAEIYLLDKEEILGTDTFFQKRCLSLIFPNI